jgi:hypothetical protein
MAAGFQLEGAVLAKEENGCSRGVKGAIGAGAS